MAKIRSYTFDGNNGITAVQFIDSGAYVLGTAITTNVLSASNVQTIAHGLGSVPVTMSCSLVVTTATGGWSIGDEIYRWIDGLTATSDTTILVGADATNISVVCGATTTVAILNKTTAAAVASALGNFKLRVRFT